MIQRQGIKITYVKAVKLELPDNQEVYCGAVLTVDAQGLPLDFQYTDNVIPNKVQRMLYGKALDRHVRTEVLFKNLIDKLNPKPQLLLVDDELLLGASLGAVSFGLLLETRLSPLNAVGTLQPVTPAECLLQVSEMGSPMRLKMPFGEADRFDKAAAILTEATRAGLDPVEPFIRIREALLDLMRADES
jgi:hypothetical protein